jgi:hypothetical protein
VQQRRSHARAFSSLRRWLGVIALVFWPESANASEQARDAALARARAMELWNDPAWLRLVHYRTGSFGGLRSEVDGAAFFLSTQGKSDPRAELLATLAAFFAPVTAAGADRHARCRFPARWHWLDARLGLARQLSPSACPKLERFRASVAAERVTLVYAANSVDSPVSAFGHTFLRFERPGRAALAVEYSADTDTNNPLLYAFKGVVGLFRGGFRQHPMTAKLEEYLGGEARDVWEYELALTAEERDQLGRHLWELSTTYFDYFYMTENCSYGVLSLLEAAAPRLDLIAETKYVVLPVDTLKAVVEAPDLVRGVRYRPALPPRPALDSVPAHAVPWEKAPHVGHGTMRVLLGTGFSSQSDNGFATLGYRIALHDLLDPPQGEPELAQIQFMDLRVRYEAERRRLTLNELTFAELMVLHPLGQRAMPSWRARGYGLRLRDGGCSRDDCFAHGMNGSLGVTLASANARLAWFAMADAHLLFSGQLDGIDGSFVRAGVGPYSGIRLQGPGQLVAQLAGSWWYLPGQSLRSTYELRGALRAGLATNVALGMETLLQPSAFEAQLLSYLYF